LQPWKRPRY